MSAQVLFALLALGMVLCVAVGLIWVLLKQQKVKTHASQAKANAKVYRSQIQDLDREHESGHIGQEEWQQSRDELSLRLLEDTSASDDPVTKIEKPAMWTAVVLALALPLSAMGLYMWLGQPEALDPMATSRTMDPNSAKADPNELAQMAEGLAKKLQAKPDNLQGWVMLGRTYRSLENYDKAIKAYDRALVLSADDDLRLERVEVMAMQRQGNFEGEPWQVIRDILQKDPQNFGALLMAGSASYAHAKYADALKYWQQARAPLTPDNPDVAGLDQAIGAVQQKLGLPVSKPEVSKSKAAVSGLNLTGRVSLSAALKSKASPTDVVFVYATPTNGERMPLAVFKSTVAQLPLSFTLDDSSAMTPERKLSAAGDVLVKVRVSKSGNAIPQSGDLVGSMGPVKVGTQGLKLEIKDLVP
jgi:cytochrome c-type biogenesis protein CcmH